jgi:hypothetical protein
MLFMPFCFVVYALWLTCSQRLKSFDCERTWGGLFQRRVVRIELYVYILYYICGPKTLLKP